MKLFINRYSKGEKETIGSGYILDDNSNILFEFDTLELPWRDNQHDISCIPPGEYMCQKRYSEKFGEHIWIMSVPDRTAILIHEGNYNYNTKGCVLVGSDLKDINKDGLIDVINSRQTLNKLLNLIPQRIKLRIL